MSCTYCSTILTIIDLNRQDQPLALAVHILRQLHVNVERCQRQDSALHSNTTIFSPSSCFPSFKLQASSFKLQVQGCTRVPPGSFTTSEKGLHEALGRTSRATATTRTHLHLCYVAIQATVESFKTIIAPVQPFKLLFWSRKQTLYTLWRRHSFTEPPSAAFKSQGRDAFFLKGYGWPGRFVVPPSLQSFNPHCQLDSDNSRTSTISFEYKQSCLKRLRSLM
ncbi:hypothetical protein B0H15DRAFT_365803 [Mycena belliarum]|uniref:Uncharacterized protein n=1 Tax=Mycena belliarum TaxID=1033014 RepID=A0AAD6U5X8_9AGAR|nr:hypothetical protein B0H15DRAFT_365803 [Mycena belliae]